MATRAQVTTQKIVVNVWDCTREWDMEALQMPYNQKPCFCFLLPWQCMHSFLRLKLDIVDTLRTWDLGWCSTRQTGGWTQSWWLELSAKLLDLKDQNSDYDYTHFLFIHAELFHKIQTNPWLEIVPDKNTIFIRALRVYELKIYEGKQTNKNSKKKKKLQEISINLWEICEFPSLIETRPHFFSCKAVTQWY